MRIRDDVELANASDVGCSRLGNEDYFVYMEPEDDAAFAQRGRRGGEIASRLAAEAVRDAFVDSSEASPRMVLIDGFQRAHWSILQRADDEPDLRGMGTTCCAAIIRDGQLYYGHVGDSRIYLLRDGVAEQLTEDHSLVADMVRQGLLTPEQAEHHEHRNVITQALGVESDSLAGDFPAQPRELKPGDIILLCTDGLHGVVESREFALVAANQSLTETCKELVALAKVRGGPDNITVQMLGIRQVEQ